ncbi:type VI secretion system Vgr family protein [Polyangium spumosum]|uniref:Type VI secretion system tip protein VgrG n=1 Tax=Polyangium spumosum TaxID=889282 RepID=A0A6N7PVU8_9BACT|nr:type VI secretion system tip protein TssI/VgrG [Polyangium spumosum]MRG96352.1 type VI secretion system tip protein VgrG [Polyangium spumosum]
MDYHDFTFAWEGAVGGAPFAHLQVVQFRGTEELSGLYRYEIVLLARVPAPEVDPAELVHARATLRIATTTAPAYKVVHGVIVEAEELGGVPEGMLYRVVLLPPLVRAKYRRRCRIFLEKTLRQIIDAVLTGDPLLTRLDGASVDPDDGDMAAFTPAAEHFTWRLTKSPRADLASARPYCVQYNESDLAFVSRLLEEEGISYHFENGDGACLLVLSDQDTGKSRLDGPLGPGLPGREVGSVKLGGRLRPKVVAIDDYNWKTPALDMRVEAQASAGTGGLFEYHWPGGFPEGPSQGAPLARAAAERYGVEAAYAVGEGPCRVLSAGSVFFLQHAKGRYEGEYLVTRLEVRGEQQGVMAPGGFSWSGVPFSCSFECARRGRDGGVAESGFRPERRTPRPRVQGTQTAFVTAEPSARDAIVHVGDLVGCVRLRFHWDHDTERLAKEPSSCWVRVSQMFAGGGEGAVGHPRVGVEVVVEFLDGDPDRPIVTGRVYNGANLPPVQAVGSATTTAWKTTSVPGGAQYNELAFDDAAGAEEIRLHAGRDLNTVVELDRQEVIKRDSISTVQQHRWENTYGDRMSSVTGDNTERVQKNERIKIGKNQALAVLANQSVSVGGNQTVNVVANQKTKIGGSQTIVIGDPPPPPGAGEGDAPPAPPLEGQEVEIVGEQKTTIHKGQSITILEGGQKVEIKGGQTVGIEGDQTVEVTGNHKTTATRSFEAGAAETMFLKSPIQSFEAVNGGAGQQMHTADFMMVTALDTGSFSAQNALALQTSSAGGVVTIKGGVIDVVDASGTNHISISAGSVTIQNAAITIQGNPVIVQGGSLVKLQADTIKLNSE